MPYFLYIMTNKPRGILYVGLTSDLPKRVAQHKTGALGGFTARYGLHQLVFVEEFGQVQDALAAEKRVKRWRRAWKIALIEKLNPDWLDLAADYL
jgi:putative endonuclease